MYLELAKSRLIPEKIVSHYPDFALFFNEINAREAFMNDIIVKTCKKHGDLTEKQTYKQKTKKASSGIWYVCKLCTIEAQWKRDCKIHGNLTVEQRTSDGRCKECHNQWGKSKRKANPTYFLEKRIADREKNPEKWERIYKMNYARERKKLNENQIKEQNYKASLNRRKISAAQYEQMVIEQENKCKICGNEETALTRGSKEVRRLCIDHCHETDMVRGLLCHKCNVMLGNACDSIEILELAIMYLNEYNERKST